MVQIKEIEVVDIYYDSKIGATYRTNPDRIFLGLKDVFYTSGLRLVGVETPAYTTIKRRYERILEKIRANKKASRTRYQTFDSEKIFFCDSEHPEICANETTATAR